MDTGFLARGENPDLRGVACHAGRDQILGDGKWGIGFLACRFQVRMVEGNERFCVNLHDVQSFLGGAQMVTVFFIQPAAYARIVGGAGIGFLGYMRKSGLSKGFPDQGSIRCAGIADKTEVDIARQLSDEPFKDLPLSVFT